MTKRSTAHATFTIERTYPSAPSKVFQAFADPKAKARWFAGPKGWTEIERSMDFRIGGRETLSGGPPGGEAHIFECRYNYIQQDERIVYTYDMYLGDRHISVSLTTVELKSAGTGTKLVFTEQAVFLDGYDDAGSRERGSQGLLEQLGAWLEA